MTRWNATAIRCIGFACAALALAACGPAYSGPVAGMPAGPRVFTADADAGWVSVVDPAAGKDVAHLKTQPKPHHLAVSPDGQEVWVTSYGGSKVEVFSATTGAR